MKKALYPSIIILALVILFLFVYRDSKRNTTASLSRIFIPREQVSFVRDVSFAGDIYKIYATGDSLAIIATKNNVFLSDKTVSSYRQLKNLKNEGTLYEVTSKEDSIFLFDVDNAKFKVIANGFTAEYNLKDSGFAGQATFVNGNYIYTRYNKTGDSVSICQLNLLTKENKEIVQLNTLLRDKVPPGPCTGSILDGGFLSISPNKWCFLFWMGGFFIISENGKLSLHQTIDKRPFKKFEERKIQMGEQTAFTCKGENDYFYNYQAASDGRYLYILSGVIEKKEKEQLSTPVDAYDLNTFEYKFTLPLPLKSVDDYAYQLAALENYIYVYNAKSKMKIYKIEK